MGSPVVITCGFIAFFDRNPEEFPGRKYMADAVTAVLLRIIREKYGTSADYLQVFDCTYCDKAQKFYVIHDGEHVTIMLAEEYYR